MNDTFANRLKTALNIRKMSAAELSRITNTPESVISQYKKGEYEPKQRRLEAFSIALNVSIPWLMGADVDMINSNILPLPKTTAVRVPVLGYVRAGIPIEAVEEILDYEEIPQSMASQGEFFGLQVKGDSMEPKISNGDVVIVRKQNESENGDIVVALVNGDEATVKKFYKVENGIKLIATNPVCESYFYTPAEIESKPVTIIGKVVELRAKF